MEMLLGHCGTNNAPRRKFPCMWWLTHFFWAIEMVNLDVQYVERNKRFRADMTNLATILVLLDTYILVLSARTSTEYGMYLNLVFLRKSLLQHNMKKYLFHIYKALSKVTVSCQLLLLSHFIIVLALCA